MLLSQINNKIDILWYLLLKEDNNCILIYDNQIKFVLTKKVNLNLLLNQYFEIDIPINFKYKKLDHNLWLLEVLFNYDISK